MSWDIGLFIASTAFSALQSYSAQKTQAAFGKAAADIQAVQATDNANMAKISGAQQEMERRHAFADLQAVNENQTRFNLGSSPSFTALQKFNKAKMERDVDRIKLDTLQRSRGFLLSAHSARVEGESFRHMGQTAWMKGAAPLIKGGFQMAKVTDNFSQKPDWTG